MEYKKSYLKIILVSLLVVVLAAFLLYYFLHLRIGSKVKEKIISLVPEWKREDCLKNFAVEKLDTSAQKIWFDDTLGHMMRNAIVLDSLSDNKPEKCLYFQDKANANSLFSSDSCLETQQDVQALYGFADKLKQKMPEEGFLRECQLFYLEKPGFKAEVPEEARDSRSKAMCRSIYSSFQKREIVLADPNFYDTPDFAGAPTCNCLDADGNQRTCKTALCRTMKFIVAVSKNDQSLCPKLDETNTLPFCNLYFDKQTTEKYDADFRESYCKKYSETK